VVSRIVAILGGVLVLAMAAGVLTEGTLAFGHTCGISDDTLMRPLKQVHGVVHTATPKPATTPIPSATPSPQATIAAVPTPTPTGATATTNSFVHLRASNSTSSAIISNLDGGTVVQLLPYSDLLWQEVRYNGQTGYIYRSYLTY